MHPLHSFSIEINKKVELFLNIQTWQHPLPYQRTPMTSAWLDTYQQSKDLLPTNDSASFREFCKFPGVNENLFPNLPPSS